MEVNSRRYNGLVQLRDYGLPTPRWQEVRSGNDLTRLRLPATEFGWTVRTCRDDGTRETGGFFLNNANQDETTRQIRDRLAAFSPPEFFLVYPSWEFSLSFNVVSFRGMYDLEGTHGSQKGISQGTETPELSLRSHDASFSVRPRGLRVI